MVLVTSASGANSAGNSKLLALGDDGERLGSFSKDAQIVDPPGLGVGGAMVFLNSASGARRQGTCGARDIGMSGCLVRKTIGI
jgi:hypothetical protein